MKVTFCIKAIYKCCCWRWNCCCLCSIPQCRVCKSDVNFWSMPTRQIRKVIRAGCHYGGLLWEQTKSTVATQSRPKRIHDTFSCKYVVVLASSKIKRLATMWGRPRHDREWERATSKSKILPFRFDAFGMHGACQRRKRSFSVLNRGLLAFSRISSDFVWSFVNDNMNVYREIAIIFIIGVFMFIFIQ